MGGEQTDLKDTIRQFLKFGLVGIVAFIIDYGLMVLFTELFRIDYLISATISFTVSVAFNYTMSMRYVFTHRDELSKKKEFAIFVALSIAGLTLNNIIMWLCVEVVSISYLIAKLVATAAVTLWNYFTRKKFLDAKTGVAGVAESIE